MEHPIQPLSLYHLDAELRQIEQALLESGGEITPEMEKEWSELLEMRENKVDGYLRMIRKFESSAEGIRVERERLQSAERTMKNAAQSLRDRLRDSMLARGDTQYVTPIGKVRLVHSSTRPVVLKVPPEELPVPFKRTIVEADLKALSEALKEGNPEAENVASFGEETTYVRIS